MKLNTNSFAIAWAFAFAILWVLCSAIVYLLPGLSLSLSGHMMHSDFSSTGWVLTWSGFIIGLIAWTICAGITGWLIAFIYNKL